MGTTDTLHINAVPLPPTNTRGPAPLASPGCPRRKGGRTGSNLGGSEQIPRKTERGPEEVRSTPQPTQGPRPLKGGGKAVHLGSHFSQDPHFHSMLSYHLSTPLPHLADYQQLPGALHHSESPNPTVLTFRPLGSFCGSPLAFLLWIHLAIKTLRMKPKLKQILDLLWFLSQPIPLGRHKASFHHHHHCPLPHHHLGPCRLAACLPLVLPSLQPWLVCSSLHFFSDKRMIFSDFCPSLLKAFA